MGKEAQKFFNETKLPADHYLRRCEDCEQLIRVCDKCSNFTDNPNHKYLGKKTE